MKSKPACRQLLTAILFFAVAGCQSKAPVESGLPLTAPPPPVPEIPGYFTSPKGGPLKDVQGRCWRTADWRPALAIEECDPALARERKLRELALTLSGVASMSPGQPPLSAPELALFEGAPPHDAATAVDVSESKTATTSEPEVAAANGGTTTAAPAATTSAISSAATAAALAAATAAGITSVAGTTAEVNAVAGPGNESVATAAPAVVAETKPGYIIKPVVLNTDAAFFFGKDRLTVAGKDAVENLAAYIKLWGIEEVQVEVVGHSDRIGSAKDNLVLSKRRADAVKQVLVETGVPTASITATGVGSSQPVTAADTCPQDIDRCELINCLAPDRRVEVGLRGTRKAPVR